jgi:hypothetical protein
MLVERWVGEGVGRSVAVERAKEGKIEITPALAPVIVVLVANVFFILLLAAQGSQLFSFHYSVNYSARDRHRCTGDPATRVVSWIGWGGGGW